MPLKQPQSWEKIWEIVWQNITEYQYVLLKKEIEVLLDSHHQQLLEEWNKIQFLDHYDKNNDTYWEKRFGNCHTVSMNIEDFDRFRDLLAKLKNNG